MKFRIKHIKEFGFFSQVKLSAFSLWKTIGKHVNGYGLYPESHINCPLNFQEEAVKRCRCFKQWKENVDQVEYIPIMMYDV